MLHILGHLKSKRFKQKDYDLRDAKGHSLNSEACIERRNAYANTARSQKP